MQYKHDACQGMFSNYGSFLEEAKVSLTKKNGKDFHSCIIVGLFSKIFLGETLNVKFGMYVCQTTILGGGGYYKNLQTNF
jgi:hypothetical protein